MSSSYFLIFSFFSLHYINKKKAVNRLIGLFFNLGKEELEVEINRFFFNRGKEQV